MYGTAENSVPIAASLSDNLINPILATVGATLVDQSYLSESIHKHQF